jgi:stearoyl-CoA desaturase (delta-9 desaturase)
MLTILQSSLVILALVGLFYAPITLGTATTTLIFYFLYSCVGVSMMLHRYYTHRSFEFKNKFVKYLCTFFAVVSCRGTIAGWVYIHRLHHKYSDTEKDPHSPYHKGWKIFFPVFMQYDDKVNIFIIKDFLTPFHIHLGRYYMLYIFMWALLLALISPWALYFAWILPAGLTQVIVSSFLYFGHTRVNGINTSKNSTCFTLLFWGEGLHKNHHSSPGKWCNSTSRKEIDITSYIIRIVKSE